MTPEMIKEYDWIGRMHEEYLDALWNELNELPSSPSNKERS